VILFWFWFLAALAARPFVFSGCLFIGNSFQAATPSVAMPS